MLEICKKGNQLYVFHDLKSIYLLFMYAQFSIQHVFYLRYTSVQVKISVMCLIFSIYLYFLTKPSISANFRMRRTHVSLSRVLSTPPWETFISSCLPRSQYISVFSVLISLFDIGGFSSQCDYISQYFK